MSRRPPALLVDAAAAVVLVVVGVSAFAGTFDGVGYLGAALLGALLGAGAVAGAAWRRRSLVPAALGAASGYVLLTPFLALRGAPSGPWPLPATWAELGGVVVHGWKDLLTTLPPVASDGRLVGLVVLVALVAAFLALALAVRTRGRFLPLAGPALALAAAAALGTESPAAVVLRGVVLALGGVVWAALRERRERVTTGEPWTRLLTAAALLGAASLVTALVAPAVLGDGRRATLRGAVHAPVELSDTTSPLAGFRRLTPSHDDLADTVLARVTGLPAGVPVRLAVLDAYSGTVWAGGTGDGVAPFLRIGSRIPAPDAGLPVTGEITVEAALASAPGLGAWLPTVSGTTSVRFAGDDAWDRDDDVRYNPTTDAAVVVGGLRAGDSYTVTGVVPPATRPDGVGAVPPPAVSGADAAITSRVVDAARSAGNDPLDQVLAVADRLRTTGAYTDGVGPTEARFTAGHSVGRLTRFLDDSEPAGDDEQYAAALALAAAQIGLPSRVALLGTPTDGVLRGRDVRAAVEVQTGPEEWYTITADRFVPPMTKKPSPRTDRVQDLTERAIVPPPNAQRPPSSTDQVILDSSSSARDRSTVDEEDPGLPTWARVLLWATLLPLALVLGYALLVLGSKALRAALRRRREPAAIIDGAWRELLDDLRDRRTPLAAHATRSETATALGLPSVRLLARQVDGVLFGRAEPTPDDATRAWERLGTVRAELRAGESAGRRLRAALSLRSLVRRREPLDDTALPSSRYAALVAPTRLRTASRPARAGTVPDVRPEG